MAFSIEMELLLSIILIMNNNHYGYLLISDSLLYNKQLVYELLGRIILLVLFATMTIDHYIYTSLSIRL